MKPNDISVYDDCIEDNIKECKVAVDSSRCYLQSFIVVQFQFTLQYFDVSLTVRLTIFISVMNQLDARTFCA